MTDIGSIVGILGGLGGGGKGNSSSLRLNTAGIPASLFNVPKAPKGPKGKNSGNEEEDSDFLGSLISGLGIELSQGGGGGGLDLSGLGEDLVSDVGNNLGSLLTGNDSFNVDNFLGDVENLFTAEDLSGFFDTKDIGNALLGGLGF